MAALGRLVRSVRSGEAVEQAKQAAAKLKADYEAGKRGDEGEPQPLWMGPREQLAAVSHALRSARQVPDAAAPTEAEVDEVVESVRMVDWAKVRSATSERSDQAAAAMKTLADQVDWQRVQPVVGKLSNTLLAAVASGYLGVGGRAGALLARTIVNEGGMGTMVAQRLSAEPSPSGATMYADVVEASATET